MERCPNCNARYRAGESCRRCGMELQQLLSIEMAVQQLTHQAFSQLSRREVSNAADTLSKRLTLRYDPFIAVVFDFCNSILQKPNPPQTEQQVGADRESLSNRRRESFPVASLPPTLSDRDSPSA